MDRSEILTHPGQNDKLLIHMTFSRILLRQFLGEVFKNCWIAALKKKNKVKRRRKPPGPATTNGGGSYYSRPPQYHGSVFPTYPVISANSFNPSSISSNRRQSSFSTPSSTTTTASVIGGFFPTSSSSSSSTSSGLWYSKPCYFRPCHKHYPGGTYYPYGSHPHYG